MFLGECNSFVDETYRIMSKYSCFDATRIRGFAYAHCAAYTAHFMTSFGRRVPKRYMWYLFRKGGPSDCLDYGFHYSQLIDRPQKIDYQWIPEGSLFDIDKYIEDIDCNPVNVSELIYLSFCFNPGLVDKSVLSRKMDDATAVECERFLAEGFMPLLDAFDRLNAILKRKVLGI